MKEDPTDQTYAIALEEYINDVVASEKQGYHSTLRPFSSYELEIRSKLQEVFQFFHKAFAGGYRTLIEELVRAMKRADAQEDLLTLAKIDPEKLKIFDDPEALVKAFEEGSSLYELFGFSEKSLNAFHKVVCRMIDEKAFEKAREVCYFLTSIAPWIPQFWICIGRCDVALRSYDLAFQEFAQAIELDPTKSASYYAIIDLLVETREYDRASQLSNAALQFTTEHQQEPWAEALREDLTAMQNEVQTAFRHSKHHAS